MAKGKGGSKNLPRSKRGGTNFIDDTPNAPEPVPEVPPIETLQV